jgi:hypothetical protein
MATSRVRGATWRSVVAQSLHTCPAGRVIGGRGHTAGGPKYRAHNRLFDPVPQASRERIRDRPSPPPSPFRWVQVSSHSATEGEEASSTSSPPSENRTNPRRTNRRRGTGGARRGAAEEPRERRSRGN